MDPRISDTIEKLIKELGKFRREIKDKGKAKADAIVGYRKRLAITLAILGHDETYELAGRTFKAPPITLRKDIAKGICAEEEGTMEITASGYTATIKNLEALEAQLNAFQSLYRHQE